MIGKPRPSLAVAPLPVALLDARYGGFSDLLRFRSTRLSLLAILPRRTLMCAGRCANRSRGIAHARTAA